MMKVCAYIRVSTEDQHRSGLGEDAQAHAIAQHVERHGWELVETYQDTASGKSTARRPGLAAALERLEDRSLNGSRPEALVVAKLDRLSRSLVDFATLAERAKAQGWRIVVIDMDFDMTTPIGEAMAGMLAVFAQFERRMIGERTKHALAAAKRRGVHVGRKPGTRTAEPGHERHGRDIPDDVIDRMHAERAAGATYKQIAQGLDRDGVPTARGGRWATETVRQVIA